MDYKLLGKKIREYRVKYKLTQEQLAEAIGMSTVFMGQIERGDRKSSISTLVKISKLFHVSVDTLLGNCDKENNKDRLDEIISLITECSNVELALISDTIKTLLIHINDNNICKSKNQNE